MTRYSKVDSTTNDIVFCTNWEITIALPWELYEYAYFDSFWNVTEFWYWQPYYLTYTDPTLDILNQTWPTTFNVPTKWDIDNDCILINTNTWSTNTGFIDYWINKPIITEEFLQDYYSFKIWVVFILTFIIFINKISKWKMPIKFF